MRIVKNENLIKRNARIGQYTSLGALAVLGVGMYISISRQDLFLYAIVALILGFAMTQIGMFFSTVNIAAYGIGSPLIGKLSDTLGVATSPDQMRYSLLVCPVASVLAAVLLYRGARLRAMARVEAGTVAAVQA